MATVRKLNFIGRTLYHCGVTPLSCPHSPDGFGVEDVVTRRQPFPWTRDMRRARRRRTMVRKNMGYPDIERARDGQAALRRIIEDYAGPGVDPRAFDVRIAQDRKSTRLNSSHQIISYAVFCLKKKIN